MGRPKSKGPYTPLAANYYMDDAILEAREHAELLFVRCLSFLATGDTDGYISNLQMRHAVGFNLRNVEKRIRTLVDVGLILPVDGGFEVRSYLKWNKSAEQIGKFRKQDRERKARQHAEDTPNSARNPDGIQTDSSDQYSAVHDSTVHGTNTSTSEVADAPIRPELTGLLDLLDERIAANGGRKPTRTKRNTDAVRLMVDRDGITVDDIRGAIIWATDDEFWRANILSMSKLREKYDQLRMAAQRQNKNTPKMPTLSNAERSALEYQALYGGDHERTGSIQALDAGVGD